MAETFWIVLIAAIAVIAAYWCGRIDGYWKRADEDRKREADAIRALEG